MSYKRNETEIDEALRFAQGALAAAGHFVEDLDIIEDVRSMLRAEIPWRRSKSAHIVVRQLCNRLCFEKSSLLVW